MLLPDTPLLHLFNTYVEFSFKLKLQIFLSNIIITVFTIVSPL